uniref:molybdopterin cofactor-binding domain-containing protein n=1 Tax=Robiginitalea biformata TaxID=252307 RepID=UPI003D3590D1
YCHKSYVAQVMDLKVVAKTPKVEKVYCAVDCGIVINPLSAKNQVEGGIGDGIGRAAFSARAWRDGRAEQSNFDTYR